MDMATMTVWSVNASKSRSDSEGEGETGESRVPGLVE